MSWNSALFWRTTSHLEGLPKHVTLPLEFLICEIRGRPQLHLLWKVIVLEKCILNEEPVRLKSDSYFDEAFLRCLGGRLDISMTGRPREAQECAEVASQTFPSPLAGQQVQELLPPGLPQLASL